ncbi:unnamed protein product, partial [Brassica rapa subsp. narinosa]
VRKLFKLGFPFILETVLRLRAVPIRTKTFSLLDLFNSSIHLLENDFIRYSSCQSRRLPLNSLLSPSWSYCSVRGCSPPP